MFEYDVGISFASEQIEIAERLYEALIRKGIKVFWSEKENEKFVGSSLFDKIVEIYEEKCRYIVPIISNEYTRKDYTRQELSIAKERVNSGDNCLIPIYTVGNTNRIKTGALFYFDLSKETEFEIASRIYRFLNNSSTEETDKSRLDKKVNYEIPRDFLIFISGATGVGKSTLARKLLMEIPQLVIIEEADMLREAIRSENDRIVKHIVDHFSKIEGINKEALRKLLKYDILKSSTINLEYEDINEQCRLILEPLTGVCFRLMDKGMPAIIEGVNLSFEAMFEDKESFYSTFLDDNNKIFINLYLSDGNEHKNRLRQRSNERREDSRKKQTYMQKFDNIRKTNENMRMGAQEYADKYSNVYNIDTLGNIDQVVNKVLKIIRDKKRRMSYGI